MQIRPWARHTLKLGANATLRISTFIALAMFTAASTKSAEASPDPLLTAGERAIVGTYRMDNVLLAPGQGVMLHPGHPMFDGFGDTPEQAAKKGLLKPSQVAALQKQSCTMTVLPDNSFVISNLPAADLSHTASLKGIWSIQVYRVFDAYGYRISMKVIGPKKDLIRAKFISAGKPNPPILEIFYNDQQNDGVMFRFTNTNWPALLQRSR